MSSANAVEERGVTVVRSDDLTTEFDRLFGELVRRAHPGRFEPNTDVYLDEANDQIVVVVELAGSDAASATYSDGILIIAIPLANANDIPARHRTEIRMTFRRTLA